MNVTELIELTNQLSVDSGYITTKERGLYLKYLNMANMELYSIAAKGLKTLTKKIDIFLDAASQSFIHPDDLFCIRLIFVDKVKLTMCDIDQEPLVPIKGYIVIGNQIFCNLMNTGLNFPSKLDPVDGLVKRYITLFYVANPLILVEYVDDPLTETDTPVYPVPYHQFLVHGALYYFYFANKIFIDKMAFIKDKWDADKVELTNFKNYGL